MYRKKDNKNVTLSGINIDLPTSSLLMKKIKFAISMPHQVHETYAEIFLQSEVLNLYVT